MNLETMILCAIAALIFIALGVYLGVMYARHAPSERAVAFKMVTAAVKRVQALESTAPEAQVAAAATAASEATALAQLQAAVAALK